MRADFAELCAEYGMGEAKSAQVKAALELGRRLAHLQVDARFRIRTPADAANLVMLELAYLDTEQMRILLLDASRQSSNSWRPGASSTSSWSTISSSATSAS